MKFPLIQIYRAIAAILVVLFHMQSNATDYYNAVFLGNFFQFGNIGVDYFFVLSGFIITFIHYNDIVNKRNIGTYVKKRLIRIYPIYWVIATVSLLSYIVLTGGYIKSMDKTLHLNSMADIIYIIQCYLLVPEVPFFIKVAWTLSFELLFYMVFAVCILSGIKTAKMIFFGWIVLILLNNYVFHLTGIMGFLTSLFILQFLIGAFVAYLLLNNLQLKTGLLVTLIAVTLLALIGLYSANNNLFGDRQISTYLLLAVNAALIIMFCTRVHKINLNNFFVRMGVLAGDASYVIYLSHIFFMSLIGRVVGKFVVKLNASTLTVNIIMVLVFLCIIAGGIFVHLFVEKPLLKKLNDHFIKRKNKQPITAAVSS